MEKGQYTRDLSDVTASFNESGKAHAIIGNAPDAVPVYVKTDGKVYARGFVDTNDNLEFFVKNNKVYAKFIKDERYGLDQSVVDLSNGSIEYQSSKPLTYTYYGNFGNYTFPRRLTDIRDTLKFTYEPQYIKREMETLQGAGGGITYSGNNENKSQTQLYTGNNGVSSDVWTKTHKHQRWFKAYKVNVMLRPEHVENIHDLVVLKTGEFGTGINGLSGVAKEKICWVSTHEVIKENVWTVNKKYYQMSGQLKNSAGVVTGTGLFTYKGASGFLADPVRTGIGFLSSKNYYYDNDELISGGMEWYRQETDPSNNLKTGVVTHGFDTNNLANTDFYKFYTGQQSKCYTGHFDGIIPANTPFKIELWRTSAKYEGMDGVVTILPLVPELTGINSTGFIIDVAVEGYGASNESFEESSTLALYDGERKKVNALDKKLIELGYATKSRNYNKFFKMIDPGTSMDKLNNSLIINISGTGTGIPS